ncbi:MAG: hypothetical protein KDA77_18185 [Planctomycetaceae bacterium]|nr:hypothetical protein [Planctomycetaceae bacterium]
MAVGLHDAILGDNLTLKQIMNASFAENVQPIRGRVSGGIDTSEIYAGEADPRLQFTTEDVATAVAVTTFCSTGLAIATSTETITVPFKVRADQGGFATGSNHYSLTSTEGGFAYPTQFQASQGGNASVDIELVLISDDGLKPFATNASASIASAAFTAQYTIGPVTINGTAITEPLSITVNPGIQVEVRRFDGLNYPQVVNIISRDPSITINFRDIADFHAFTGSVAGLSSFSAFFRKRDATGFVAEATEEHVKFTFADGLLEAGNFSVSGQESGTPSITVHGETLVGSATNAIA